MTIKDTFKKGYVELLILKLLSDADLYGYEMTQLIVERGDGYIKVPEGSLYPTLYKLEDKNSFHHMKSRLERECAVFTIILSRQALTV